MAKVHVAETPNKAADMAIQLQGARGYSKDTVVEWIYRYARSAKLVDGASEVHMMVLAKFMRRPKAVISGNGGRAKPPQRAVGLDGGWALNFFERPIDLNPISL